MKVRPGIDQPPNAPPMTEINTEGRVPPVPGIGRRTKPRTYNPSVGTPIEVPLPINVNVAGKGLSDNASAAHPASAQTRVLLALPGPCCACCFAAARPRQSLRNLQVSHLQLEHRPVQQSPPQRPARFPVVFSARIPSISIDCCAPIRST